MYPRKQHTPFDWSAFTACSDDPKVRVTCAALVADAARRRGVDVNRQGVYGGFLRFQVDFAEEHEGVRLDPDRLIEGLPLPPPDVAERLHSESVAWHSFLASVAAEELAKDAKKNEDLAADLGEPAPDWADGVALRQQSENALRSGEHNLRVADAMRCKERALFARRTRSRSRAALRRGGRNSRGATSRRSRRTVRSSARSGDSGQDGSSGGGDAEPPGESSGGGSEQVVGAAR